MLYAMLNVKACPFSKGTIKPDIFNVVSEVILICTLGLVKPAPTLY